MTVQDLRQTKLTRDKEGYGLSFTDPEWGDQVHVAHMHFDSDHEEAKKGAALLRAAYEMQQSLDGLVSEVSKHCADMIDAFPELRGAFDYAIFAIKLSENAAEVAE